jgi:hypothetical protein
MLALATTEKIRVFQVLESLSFALYGKRQTPGKEKCYGIRQ